MQITIEAIIARMKWAAAHQLAEFAFSESGQRITIRRDTGEAAETAAVAASSVVTNPVAAPETVDAVTAPLAGMCHMRPESGGTPFVSVGARIEAGQTICIIEAMKMMTPIPAPHAGTVEAILVEDGATVAAGSPLMRIR